MRVSFPVLLVGILVTATVLLLVRPRPLPWAEAPQVAEPVPQRSPFLRWRPLLCVVGAAGAWAMVGGRFGPLAAVVGAIAVWVVLGRSEDPALARRRERLAEDLPVGVDLLGSCLDSGAALEPALLAVADALEGPVAEEFRAIHHRLAIGVAPAKSVGEASPATRSSARWGGPPVTPTRPGRRWVWRCATWPRSSATAPVPRSRRGRAASRWKRPHPSGCACCRRSCCSAWCRWWPASSAR